MVSIGGITPFHKQGIILATLDSSVKKQSFSHVSRFGFAKLVFRVSHE